MVIIVAITIALCAVILATMFFKIIVGELVENSKTFAKIVAKFTGGMAVVLTDYTGSEYITIARTRGGKLTAPVYYFTNVGKVYLNSDGTVEEHYIKTWVAIK